MEGLLPMVYKAIKKNRTRRKYQCLSSGAALSYSISMTEIHPPTQGSYGSFRAPSTHKVTDHDAEKFGHRRYKSVGDFGYGFSSSPPQTTGEAAGSHASKQLVRIRSHKMFSCITGV